MIAPLFALVLQGLVPPGDYKICTVVEAGSLTGVLPPRWGLEFYELPNYLFMDLPGSYELKDYRIHWISGPLQGEAPGDYDPTTKTVRFHPNLPAGSFPFAALATCGEGDGIPRVPPPQG